MCSQQVQLLEGGGDALVLFLQERREVVAGLELVDPAVVVEGLLPLVGLVHLLEHPDELVATLLADARGREDPAPVGEDEVDARLGQGGCVADALALEPLLAGDGEQAQLARLQRSDELTDPGEADGEADDRSGFCKTETTDSELPDTLAL